MKSGRILAAVGLALAFPMNDAASATQSGGKTSTHASRPIGVDLSPLFHLTNQNGGHLLKSQLTGKPAIVLFGYTSCPDVCPTSLFEVSLLLRDLGADGDRMNVLFVTVDPARDTVETLKAYLKSFDDRIIGLTGADAEIAAVAKAFGAPISISEETESTGVEHSSLLFLIDRYGLLAQTVRYDDSKELLRFASRLLAQ